NTVGFGSRPCRCYGISNAICGAPGSPRLPSDGGRSTIRGWCWTCAAGASRGRGYAREWRRSSRRASS
ncbi:hypothetical protein LTR94_032448, partial [Friedmanniomyces endolithicus]